MSKNSIIVLIFLAVAMTYLFPGQSLYSPIEERSKTMDIALDSRDRFTLQIPESWKQLDTKNNSKNWTVEQSPSKQKTLLGRPSILKSTDSYLSLVNTSTPVSNKYSLAILDNPKNLTIDEWLLENSGSEPLALIKKEELLLDTDLVAHKYVYGDPVNGEGQGYISTYISVGDKIIALSSFVFDRSLVSHEATLEKQLKTLRRVR